MGGMAEWTNAPALRAGGRKASWVQIPIPPYSDANETASSKCSPAGRASIGASNWYHTARLRKALCRGLCGVWGIPFPNYPEKHREEALVTPRGSAFRPRRAVAP